MQADELVRWGFPAEATRGSQLFTRDGSLLVGDVVSFADDRLVALLDLFGEARFARDQLAAIVFQPPGAAGDRDRLMFDLLDGAREADRVMLVNGDTLTGTIRELTGDRLSVELQGSTVELPIGRVAAAAFGKADSSAQSDAPPRWLVGFEDGTLLRARSVMATDEAVDVVLPDGDVLRSDAPQSLTFLQRLAAPVLYLSDRQPYSFQHDAFLDLAWPLRADRNVAGGRLRAGGHLYAKGLGVHSAARLVYRLDEPLKRFAAEVAIDDHTDRRGSVVFRVFLLKGQEWEAAWNSKVVRGGDPPVPVSVDLADARAVALVVDFADRGDQWDRANWLDARLIGGAGDRGGDSED
jgi:hypothetical protein